MHRRSGPDAGDPPAGPPDVLGVGPARVREASGGAGSAGDHRPGGASPNRRDPRFATRLGLGAAEFLVVGAAPLAVETHDFFSALGLPLCEVWGMSETCGLDRQPAGRPAHGHRRPPAAGSRATDRRRPARNREPVGRRRGLARGAMLMRGYRGEPSSPRPRRSTPMAGCTPAISASSMRPASEDHRPQERADHQRRRQEHVACRHRGALKTGGPLIGQACVIGDRRPYNVALMLLDPDAAAAFASERTDSRTARPTRVAREPAVSRRGAVAVSSAPTTRLSPGGADQAL